jgi:DNA repair protein RadC
MTYDIISKRISKKVISIKKPDDLYQFMKRYSKSRQEQFFVITLDSSKNVIGIHISSIGTNGKIMVHPREVFYKSIIDNSVSIIISHNHPSGNLLPSKHDEDMTERLIQSGKILGIHVIDHIIFSKNGYFSFRENGYCHFK